MKRTKLHVLPIIFLICSTAFCQEIPHIPKIAVLNFAMRGDISDFEADTFIEKLRREVKSASGWQVFDRQDMFAALHDSLPNSIRAQDLSEAQAIGKKLDAKLVLYGRIARQDSVAALRLFIYDIERNRAHTSLTRSFLFEENTKDLIVREILHDLDIGPNLHANANDSSGVMKVFSEPDSCLVFLDNEMLGYTPLQLGYLEAKDYEIRLEKENYRAARGIVSVQNGHVQKIHMILRSEVRITIESDPPGAMIYVNDAPVGLSPKTIRATAELPYNFRFTHPDFNDVEKQLSFSKDKRLTVEFGTDMKKWVYIGGGSAATLGVLYYLVYRGTEADARKEGGLPAPPGRP